MLDLEDAGDLGNARRHLLALHALADQGIGDVLAHVHMRVEREHLEDEGDVALLAGFMPTSSPSMNISPESAIRGRPSCAMSSSCRSRRAEQA